MLSPGFYLYVYMITLKKRDWIEIVLHLAFWAGVFYTLTSLNRSHIHTLKTPSFTSDQYEDPISSYVYLILLFLAVLFYGNIFWVFRKVIRYKNVIVRLAICAGWFTLIFGANYFIVGPSFRHATVVEPLPDVPFQKDGFIIKNDLAMSAPHPDLPQHTSFVNFTISNWQHLQSVILLAFLVILGISIAYFFLKEWAKSELIQTQLQANQLSTEIKFLKSQINPHFLFNTLNNLFSMAQSKGNDELADGISKLSGMMRYMLYDSNAESVSLSTEITYLEEFITLNKLRYADDEVTVSFCYPQKDNTINIAPMLFIPFVENAFKHGVAIGQTTIILINVIISGQIMIFTCENTNYSGIKRMAIEKSGIGLENVKRRLELLYPGKHQLQITKTDEKYMVKLEINLA
jgi:two-component system LytT family sensor kinase